MKLITLIILLFSILIIYYASPFFTTLFSSLLIAYLFEPINYKINKYVKNWNVSCFFSTIISVSIFITLYYLFTRMIIVSLVQMQSIVDTNLLFLTNYMKGLGFEVLLESNPTNFIDFFETLISNAPKLILEFLLLNFMVFYLLKDSPNLKKYFFKTFSKNRKQKIKYFINRSNYILKNILFEYFFVAIIISLTVFIALNFLNINYAIELSTISLIMTTFPIISGWMLLFALSIYYLIKSNIFNFTILLIVSVQLLFLDYYFDKLFKDKKGINPLMMVLGLFSGVSLLGVLGFVAGPILAGIIQAGYETIFNN